MLIQFSVSNFMSIKNTITLSMLAGTDKEHMENLTGFGKENILKSVAIYGANAAGKTNIFRALTSAIILVRRSSTLQINEKLTMITPFRLDNDSKDKPTNFDFIINANGIKYEYGFSADADRIYTEYLYQYKTSKASLIFERTDTNVYKFNKKEEKKLKEFVSKNTDNKLFLATATTWNYEKTKDVFMWFAEGIDTYEDYANLEGFVLPELEKEDNGELSDFIKKMLQCADINIDNYHFNSKEMSPDDIAKFPVPPIYNEINPNLGELHIKQYNMTTSHRIVEEDGSTNNYELEYDVESKGTRSLFSLSPVLKKAFDRGKTIVIDEIDSSLHPLIVDFIIDLFNNPEINTGNAQLVFNTHDVNLLSLSKFRRDQIYFVEKNPKTAITDLYSLDEFSPRKTENVRKGYLEGRYGAIPIIGSGDYLW